MYGGKAFFSFLSTELRICFQPVAKKKFEAVPAGMASLFFIDIYCLP